MKTLSIDEVMHKTWLMVSQLRNGWQAQDGKGLYRLARAQVDDTRETLNNAGLAKQDIDHILYAQCALLDGAVMSRETKDDGYREWLDTPLQSRYFNSLGAGEQLWERIRSVLREPAPNIAVLTCFHRVLLLGFSGQYRDEDSAQRETVLAALTPLVPPFRLSPSTTLVAKPLARRYRSGARSWWWRGLAVIAVLLLLWWGLNLNLQQFVQQQLSS